MDNVIHWPDGDHYDIGVVVGRFQVPEFHEGHKYLLDRVTQNHRYTMIVVGVSPVVGTRSDPLDYLTRLCMLRNIYPEAIIYPIMDMGSDTIWSANLDSIIKNVFPNQYSVRLYGGRDSFISHYNGNYPRFEIPELHNCSGTSLRGQIMKPIDSVEFRAGMIFAANSKPFPTIATTVDIACVNEFNSLDILMGSKKVDEGLWRLPGGFFDIKDSSFEAAARRELMEETGLGCNDVYYLGNFTIDDWRYQGSNLKLHTVLFYTKYFAGMPKANDDLDDVRWFNLRKLTLDEVVPNHHVLINCLKQKLL